MVAEKSLEGMINNELHVIFGGEERLRDHILNFENPTKFDEHVSKIYYGQRREESLNHRAL